MMKNVLNLYYFCIYFKNRPKNDLVLFRFVLYKPQGLKTYQSCRRSFPVNSFRVLADSATVTWFLDASVSNTSLQDGMSVCQVLCINCISRLSFFGHGEILC